MLSHTLFVLILLLLVLTLLTSFLLTGPLAWLPGLLYIGYDTWLLIFVAVKSRPALKPCGLPGVESEARGPTIAVLIPARNEKSVLAHCLRALADQTDPPEEIHIIDDGSRDGTRAWLKSVGLGPNARVWEKPHTGKADSLNLVWPCARSEVLVTIDADTILDPGAIAAVRRAFAGDARLAAACGVLAPRCRPAGLGRIFELFQTFEYLRAFIARAAWMRCSALLLVSGAFAAYRREALEKLGGYDPNSLVEDYDLIHRLHRYAGESGRIMKVALIPGARAVTDAPASMKALFKQRQRWFAGFLQTQFKNRDMVGNPRYGAVGTLMLPIKAADTLQPIYGLTAVVLLAQLALSGRGIPGTILGILAAKLGLDLVFHFWFVFMYHRWQGMRIDAWTWISSAIASLTEPFSFQLLRHTGAMLGWLGFLSGRSDWTPQRQYQQAVVEG